MDTWFYNPVYFHIVFHRQPHKILVEEWIVNQINLDVNIFFSFFFVVELKVEYI